MRPPVIQQGEQATFKKAWAVLRLGRTAYPAERGRAVSYFLPRVSWILCAMAIGGHVAWALSSCPLNFGRGGAAVTMIAALAAAMTDWHAPNAMVLDGGPANVFRLLEPKIAIAMQVLLGTAIWGYGDLLPFLRQGYC